MKKEKLCLPFPQKGPQAKASTTTNANLGSPQKGLHFGLDLLKNYYLLKDMDTHQI